MQPGCLRAFLLPEGPANTLTVGWVSPPQDSQQHPVTSYVPVSCLVTCLKENYATSINGEKSVSFAIKS